MTQGPELIQQYFPNLSEQQQAQFAQLAPLYAEWNAQINVISRKDIDALYERHVLHSLGIVLADAIQPATSANIQHPHAGLNSIRQPMGAATSPAASTPPWSRKIPVEKYLSAQPHCAP